MDPILEIDAYCPHCKDRISCALTLHSRCPKCREELVRFSTDKFAAQQGMDQCVLCGCADVYRHRDFNRRLGITLVVLGVLLAYFTYGISILVLTALDYFLYRRVGEVVSCYRCGAVYRNPPHIERNLPFNLSLNDYYRSLPKKTLS